MTPIDKKARGPYQRLVLPVMLVAAYAGIRALAWLPPREGPWWAMLAAVLVLGAVALHRIDPYCESRARARRK